MWPLRSNRQQFRSAADCSRVRRITPCLIVADRHESEFSPSGSAAQQRCSIAKAVVDRSSQSLGSWCSACSMDDNWSSQAARAIRTATLGVGCPRSTGGLSTGWSPPALQCPTRGQGRFILGRASHLDAFSGYHSRPSLPGAAPGGATGTRAGRPTRSSRTRVRPPQSSNAHDGYRPNCLTTF